MPPSLRTRTSNRTTLTLPGPAQATFTFLPDENKVKVTIPPTSTWSMRAHWHDRPELCEDISILPGGYFQIYRSTGVYANYTTSGIHGLSVKLRPGERCGWGFRSASSQVRNADLEVLISQHLSKATEEAWRNIVSATLDAELWPELASTPLPLKVSLRLLRKTPFVGQRMWTRIVRAVLWMQILLICQRHELDIWLGELGICWFWAAWRNEVAPEWAQSIEWNSAEWLTWLVMLVVGALGRGVLGLKDGYDEYYRGTGTNAASAGFGDEKFGNNC
ncbi:hypothetical protein PFICI_00290 [Pestalotiopsis fici W106-1]|uniref:Uncharacterized protein n=1 Tax=Pestalotiopsis fici (strain W106-1 / CGMCC3.15140) TaxID=1229662 RepID=W3XLV7_PESFW|nr:uncharacterized protein PFICI_00290 [Pestalotiopsis fici W106-1]ETS86462.1 hypothetical protein PFICI_00290 [Pestalotiopsis fici W106-1]